MISAPKHRRLSGARTGREEEACWGGDQWQGLGATVRRAAAGAKGLRVVRVSKLLEGLDRNEGKVQRATDGEAEEAHEDGSHASGEAGEAQHRARGRHPTRNVGCVTRWRGALLAKGPRYAHSERAAFDVDHAEHLCRLELLVDNQGALYHVRVIGGEEGNADGAGGRGAGVDEMLPARALAGRRPACWRRHLAASRGGEEKTAGARRGGAQERADAPGEPTGARRTSPA